MEEQPESGGWTGGGSSSAYPERDGETIHGKSNSDEEDGPEWHVIPYKGRIITWRILNDERLGICYSSLAISANQLLRRAQPQASYADHDHPLFLPYLCTYLRLASLGSCLERISVYKDEHNEH